MTRLEREGGASGQSSDGECRVLCLISKESTSARGQNETDNLVVTPKKGPPLTTLWSCSMVYERSPLSPSGQDGASMP